MNIVISIFLIGTLACEILVVVWLYKHKNLEYVQKSNKTRRVRHNKSTKEEIYIPPPSPESIANITNPPRPAGGFGSSISKNDGCS